MFTQAVDVLKRDFTDSLEWQVEEARAQLGSLEQFIVESAVEGTPSHEGIRPVNCRARRVRTVGRRRGWVK
jgi:hypothetical protein